MQVHAHPHHANDPTTGKSRAGSSHIAAEVRAARAAFDSGRTRSYAWRSAQLEGLLRMLEHEEQAITASLHRDVGKPEFEAWGSEVNSCRTSIQEILRHLKDWMKPERVRTTLIAQPGSSQIVREPLGVALIIAPWNYPFMLAMQPLAGAVAAGNCVVLKPSELALETSRLFARLLPKYVDPECIRVVEGAVPETTELLSQRFDHIFFTGSTAVGRIVMQAAAQHLTPVTLELGGKSPCIVDASADLHVSARRIVWGKFYNAGQSCIAPDYVLVHKDVRERLLELMVQALREFYGDNPQASPDFGRIVNPRHLHRLLSMIPGSGRVVVGGAADEADRCYLAPTILTDVPERSPIMESEIFGPILPVIEVDGVDHAIRFVTARPKPLALYLFTSDDATYEDVVSRTSAGGMAVNHCLLHAAVFGLPFGGVGESGMGAYHGRASFETFSHRKSVLRKSTMLDPKIQYPPYTESKQAWTRRLL